MKCNKKEALRIGTKVEMEHAHLFPKSNRKSMAIKITKDHIKESPCYYKELKKLESKLNRRKK